MCILVCVYVWLQEAKGRIAKGKCARANEQQFAILLLRAGFVEVRELGFLGEGYLCSVCLIVEGQGLVGIFEIVKRLIFFPILFCNPVQELCAILLVLRVVSLILFKSKVMSFLFIQCSLAAVTRQGFCEIVAADESGRVENGPANHDSNRRHCVWYMYGLHTGWRPVCAHTLVCQARVHSHICWKYLLIRQVFLQGDAASHDGGELGVVHQAGAGVASEVFFDNLFANPPNPSDKAGDGCGVEERFDELVAAHSTVALVMTQAVFAARHLNRQSVCMTLLFISTTTEVSPPIAIPIRAPSSTATMASPRVRSFMAWGIYRVQITPFSLCRVLPELETWMVLVLVLVVLVRVVLVVRWA